MASRANESQPHALYEALFGRLLAGRRRQAPGHCFRFGNRLLSLDSTTIDVCLWMFPWAKYKRTKGAVVAADRVTWTSLGCTR